MGKITIELLRKRSEHNEGEIHSLEELALHQEKLERIELIDKACRNVKILLLQNNAISKIENVARLKHLEYLNLALNIVERIENLEGCESLKKLDLTLNFVAELTSIKSLRNLQHLEQLYLTGNPCHDFSGYREYVVGVLPQLKFLDGREITQSERINAAQEIGRLENLIVKQQNQYFEEHKNADNNPSAEDTFNESNATKLSSDTQQGYEVEDDDSEFWNQKSEDTPEVRKAMIRHLELQDEKKKPKESRKVKAPRKLKTADGKPLNINEAKLDFFLNDEWENSQLVLDLSVPKHLCTTLVNADVQPWYVTATVKGKVFQLVLPEEVKPDSSSAQRSQITGHLIITMPKVHDTSVKPWNTKERPIELKIKGSRKPTQNEKQPVAVPVSNTSSTTKDLCSQTTIMEDDVPPLI